MPDPRTTPIDVPDEFAASHASYFGEAGRRWIAALPALAAERLEVWELRLDGAARWGAVALVLPVVRADDTPAALKLQPVDDETGGEPVALRVWDGRGAVRLLAHDAPSGSLLLERLDATRPLASVADDLAALELIARLLVELHAAPPPAGMRRLADIAAAMLDDVPATLPLARDPTDRELLRACAARLAELLAEPVTERLLHWDLHYDNVLASLRADGGHPWLAIDPKPLLGDPGFDLLPALWNRWDDVAATGDVTVAVLRRFDLMTEVLGLERSRAAGWTLTRVLQNALWDLGELDEPAIDPTHRAIAETLLAHRA